MRTNSMCCCMIGVPDERVMGRMPGHSIGSTCYHVDNVLLSGDVLFYRTADRTETRTMRLADRCGPILRSTTG